MPVVYVEFKNAMSNVKNRVINVILKKVKTLFLLF